MKIMMRSMRLRGSVLKYSNLRLFFLRSFFGLTLILLPQISHANLPEPWPEKVDLIVGESHTYTLQDGSQRTIKLLSYDIVIPRHKVKATVEVSGNNKTETHTLEVALAGVPVSINGLRVYAYAWKEANQFNFEQVWPTGAFPLTDGKDVGFALSDANSAMFPDLDSFTYPVEMAFHEGNDLQTFLEPKDGEQSEAHAGYDIKIPLTTRLIAMHDGYVWSKAWGTGEGGVWLTLTDSEYNSPGTWIWTHVKNGELIDGIVRGAFVTKGTPLAFHYNGSRHFHMGGTSLDYGTFLFTAEIWMNEHKNDFPAPRYWLVMGPYDGGMDSSHIASNESGNIPTITPKEGMSDQNGNRQWKFRDNYVNSVVMMNELLSESPFSGKNDRNPTNSVAYAATYVFSPVDHTSDNIVHLKWGSSYGAKIWLNGTSVIDNSDILASHRYNSFDPLNESTLIIDESDISLPLQKGWNTLIIKTNHGSRAGTAWRFSAKIGDANGNRIPDLKFSTRDVKLQATSPTENKVQLSWFPPDFHGTHVDTYKLDVATDEEFSNIVINDRDIGNVTSYEVTNLPGGQVHYFRIRPFNGEMGGTTYWNHTDSVGAIANGENAPVLPLAPENLSATSGDSEISLIWTGSFGATSYHVKRSLSSDGPFSLQTSVSATSYKDSSVINGTAYFYQVTAVNSIGESNPSNTATATPQGGGGGDDTTPPVISSMAIFPSPIATTISWQTDEPATSQAEYGFSSSLGTLTTLNSNLVTVHSVPLTGLTPGTVYHVRVRSQDAAGNESISEISVFTSPTSTNNDPDNVPFSLDPPGGLSPDQVPLFVNIVSDDNGASHPEGLKFMINVFKNRTNPQGTGNPATYDGTPALGVFNNIGENEANGMGFAQLFVDALQTGHEMGNHSYTHRSPYNKEKWRDEIIKTNAWFTRPVGGDGVKIPVLWDCTTNEQRDCMILRSGLGMDPSEIYGMRAPFDGWDEDLLDLMDDEFTFTYLSNSAIDHPSQPGSFWPGTLDSGHPPEFVANTGKPAMGIHPGIWELPQTYLKNTGICDSDWFFDFKDLGVTREAHILQLLKDKVDERLAGNRAPFQLCLHTEPWGAEKWITDPASLATINRKQQMLSDFIDYAVSKPEVRVVRQIDVIRWMRNPVPLGSEPGDPLPIPDPDGPKLNVSSPQNGQVIVGETVEVSYSISGDTSEVDHINFLLDDTIALIASPSENSIQLTQVPFGSHNLKGHLARANNSKILNSDTTITFITKSSDETSSPTLQIISPTEGQIVPDGVVTVQYQTAGDLSEVDHITLELDGTTQFIASPLENTLDIPNVPVGNHVLTGRLVRADDSVIAGSDVSVNFAAEKDVVNLPLPTPPESISGKATSSSSVQWSWNPVSFATGYKVYLNDQLISSPTQTSFTQDSTQPNTAYTVQVSAVNNSGESALTTSPSVVTLASIPSNSSITSVSVSSILISWTPNGNPAGTNYEAEYFKSGQFVLFFSGTDTSATLSKLMPNKAYTLRVRAVNLDGISTDYDAEISATTSAFPQKTFQITDFSIKNVIQFDPPTGPVTLEILPHTFSEPLEISFSIPSVFASSSRSPISRFTGTDVGIEITPMSMDNKPLQPKRAVILSVSYRTTDVDGLEEAQLILSRFDETRNLWVRLTSQPDPLSNRIVGQIKHFSTFRIMQASPSDSVTSVKAFPNPFRPTQGHDTITFSDLPASSRIRIYTLAGELVRDLSADVTGTSTWDVRNEGGKDVASGVYFVLVDGNGETDTFKIAVQR